MAANKSEGYIVIYQSGNAEKISIRMASGFYDTEDEAIIEADKIKKEGNSISMIIHGESLYVAHRTSVYIVPKVEAEK